MGKFKVLALLSMLMVTVLSSCGVQNETVQPEKVSEVQSKVEQPVDTQSGVAQVEAGVTNSGTVEGISTGSIKEESTGSVNASIVDSGKPFNMDDYLPKGTYSIVQRFEKGSYIVLTVDPNTNTGVINNTENGATCVEQNISSCINFITSNGTLLYTNLKKIGSYENFDSLTENLGGIYKLGNSGAIFYNVGVGGGMGANATAYRFTYINFSTLKKIYEAYVIREDCDLDAKDNCIKGSKKTTYIKDFFNAAGLHDPSKKLDIKAANIEDAYFEYFKEDKASIPQIDNSGASFEDLGLGFKITQTKNTTTLSFSGNEIFKVDNTRDNMIIAGGYTWCNKGGEYIIFDNLPADQKESCMLGHLKTTFAVDTKNIFENRFVKVTKGVYEGTPPAYIYDMDLKKAIKITSPFISKFLRSSEGYLMLYSPNGYDCGTGIDLLTKDDQIIAQINECDISNGKDKYGNEITNFELTSDGRIKVIYKNGTKVISPKLK